MHEQRTRTSDNLAMSRSPSNLIISIQPRNKSNCYYFKAFTLRIEIFALKLLGASLFCSHNDGFITTNSSGDKSQREPAASTICSVNHHVLSRSTRCRHAILVSKTDESRISLG